MKFRYQGFDRTGQRAEGTIEAGTRAEAGEALARRAIYATQIQEQNEGEIVTREARQGWGFGSRQERVAGFLRQLAVLIGTGTTVVEAIGSIERQTRDERFRSVLADVRRRVEEGQQLCEALSFHPQYFDGVCRSLIAAGESGGKLDAMTLRLATLLRQQIKTRKTVMGAMIYPMLLSVVAVGVMGAMFGFVLPRFETLFESLDAPLPPTTKVLMQISAGLRTYWWALAGGLAVLGGTAWWWMGRASGRAAMQRLAIRTPQLGKAIRSLITARIARLLGVLLDAKMPLIEALRLAKQSVGHVEYAALLTKAEESVTRGENMSAVFSDARLITPTVCEAMRSGEKTGQVASVLGSVADALDEDNEVLIRTATGLIEPIILIIMGLGVGFVALSMFMPLFDLTSTAGGGGGPG